ncbi:hypothetical protein CR162_05690 [Pseudoroseomonas rhizosphaerae]|uniref:Uncharacterized protein n=1 Tax=Teichococcus rhizosphaerae TaxID=1335062 RepID=A0A2C7AGL7_9PROT|nr:hypothetical protein [Pseudoroseomonas rhizosphaerae]PHK95837.1 hypothetical protein CR162_05690 [Pseudoroseomonas rhizosphaerae]
MPKPRIVVAGDSEQAVAFGLLRMLMREADAPRGRPAILAAFQECLAAVRGAAPPPGQAVPGQAVPGKAPPEEDMPREEMPREDVPEEEELPAEEDAAFHPPPPPRRRKRRLG